MSKPKQEPNVQPAGVGELGEIDGAPIVIRPSMPDDAEEMLAVARSLGDWFDDASFEEMADDLADDPGVVAVLHGRIAGWATWYPSSDSPDPKLMELTWIAVRRDLRGRGIGRALMAGVEETLHSEGIRTVELWRPEIDRRAPTCAPARSSPSARACVPARAAPPKRA